MSNIKGSVYMGNLPAAIRAAFYIRVSTDEQTEYSPSAQRKIMESYALSHNMQYTEAHIYADKGLSGRTAQKRPEFMRMISAAKSKPRPFDVILVHKFDRFARNREDSVVYKSMLKKHCGIRVISVTESAEDEDGMSGLVEAMLEAMAEYYSINLSEEVHKGMTEKALRGGFQTSPPLGYTVNERNGLTILPEEADTVREIFRLYAIEGKGIYQISKILASSKSRSKRGNIIEPRGVKYILGNVLYTGKVRWTPGKDACSHKSPIIAQGSHPAIISNELFQLAAHKLESEKNTRICGRQKSSVHWLSGCVTCSNCGAYIVQSGKSLQCRGYAAGKCPVSHSVSQNKLEKAILEDILQAVSPDSTTYRLCSAKEIDNIECQRLKSALRKTKKQLTKISDDYLSGIYVPEEYMHIKTDIEKSMSKTQEQLKMLLKSGTNTCNSSAEHTLSSVLLSASNEMKKRLFRSIITSAVFNRSKDTVELYYL